MDLIDTRDQLLSFLDDEISDALSYHLRNNNVLIRHNEEYERVEGLDNGVILHLKSGKKIKADALLWCNGRTGNTDKLGLAGSPYPSVAELLEDCRAAVVVEAVTDRAEAQKGDLAVIDFFGYVNGETFKGGKGIPTMFGVLLAMSPTATLVAALVWAVALALTRYASVGSLCAAASIPVYFAWSGAPSPHLMFGVVACAMAFVRHRSNIRNLIAGRELRFGAGGQGSSPAGETAEGMKAAP